MNIGARRRGNRHAAAMDERLEQALVPVVSDIRACGVPEPAVVDGDWSDDAMDATAFMNSADGSLIGLRVRVDGTPMEQIVEVAEQVQEWVIEELWPAAATNWPPCPHHPETHPLSAAVRDGAAVWACPTDATAFATIGGLTAVS